MQNEKQQKEAVRSYDIKNMELYVKKELLNEQKYRERFQIANMIMARNAENLVSKLDRIQNSKSSQLEASHSRLKAAMSFDSRRSSKERYTPVLQDNSSLATGPDRYMTEVPASDAIWLPRKASLAQLQEPYNNEFTPKEGAPSRNTLGVSKSSSLVDQPSLQDIGSTVNRKSFVPLSRNKDAGLVEGRHGLSLPGLSTNLRSNEMMRFDAGAVNTKRYGRALHPFSMQQPFATLDPEIIYNNQQPSILPQR